MNWYRLSMIILLVLVSWMGLLMGACAYAALQYGNTLAMYKMLICVGLCMIIMKEIMDD